MLDFMMVTAPKRKEKVEIYPKFMAKSFTDLMIRGSDFYAIWNEDKKLWSTSEEDALYLIDREIDLFAEDYMKRHPEEKHVNILHMWDVENGMLDRWHKYVKQQCRDRFKPLDEKLIFSNMSTTKNDYASKKLPYPLIDEETPAYDEMMSVLYSPEERHKLEWAIGAIVSGDSKRIEKFIVMYGAPKTGKSTVINIILDLFEGYTSVFDSQVLGSASSAFALEAFRSNPLVAVQHDGDLSRIENNARINSLVSHEDMVINEKFRSSYTMHFNSFLIMGTNKPVRITDSKSGLLRRLIDVSPTGNRIPKAKYDSLKERIKFELGGIAKHCLDVYEENPKFYDGYTPITMIGASNDFYNYVLDSYDVFKKEDGTTLKAAYEMYKAYCDNAKVPHPYPQRVFKEELKSYFREFEERSSNLAGTGTRPWNVYRGFITNKFKIIDFDLPKEKKSDEDKSEKQNGKDRHLLELNCDKSVLDDILKDCPAQYANDEEAPIKKWANVTTKLSDLDTTRLHYVKVPENHIVIDFDLKDNNGNKSLELNAEAAAKWPKTYAELSKGGQGIHLHYLYSGDVTKLSRVFDSQIEIKVFTGGSSLRRRLSKCNDLSVATINSGLPLKEENKKKMLDFKGFKNDEAIRTYIKRAINKEYASSTRQSMSLIRDALEKAYSSGIQYDISDMAPAIMAFARKSSNSSDWCYTVAGQLKLRSEELLDENFEKYDSDTLVFFDCEVFPNLFLVVYKAEGEDKKCVPLINPSPRDIEELFKLKLVGFNCKKYDNHICYARLLGETNAQIFNRSAALVDNSDKVPKPYIAKAYGVSWTDIWDFAVDKRGLKKWEIALKIPHKEFSWDWNTPVPEELWPEVVKYCINDVMATEAVFHHLSSDYDTRVILAMIAGGTVNDATNKLTTKFMFGNNKHPQDHFMYRNLAEPVYEIPDDMRAFLEEHYPEMMAEPHGEAKSILPYFPGYTFNPYANGKKEKSKYRGYNVGEGGFVYAEPGMYSNVWSLDSASHHPNSICTEYTFGDYTPRFYDILQSRIYIKHKDFEKAGQMLDGKLVPFLGPDSDTKALSTALKRVVNSTYGLTAQEERDDYISAFRDPRNIDNLVAKRGALFMVDLLDGIRSQGGSVIHCKTDSQKLVNPSKELMDWVFKFAKRYGYTFEVEHHFEKICLVNNAVYIAKLATDDEEWLGACEKAKSKGLPEPTRWTATGAQFQVPFLFKTLFSHEPIIFDDYCETKSVQKPAAMYLDMNEGLPAGEHNYVFIGSVGEFTPVKPGVGGGTLVAKRGDEKYDAVSGTKGYLWMESENIRNMRLEHPEDLVDKSYYISLVDEAVKDISKFGDFEWFVS